MASWSRNANGYYGHADNCTCLDCQRAYESHNAGYEPCVCHPCEVHNYQRNVPYQSDEKGKTIVAGISMCDRCNSMAKAQALGGIKIHKKPGEGDKAYELCPGCIGDFLAWLKEDIMTTRERAYSEPWSEEKTVSGDILTKEKLRELLGIEASRILDDE